MVNRSLYVLFLSDLLDRSLTPHLSSLDPATTRQLHTMQSLSVAHNVDLPFLDDPEQQINRAGASRLIEFLMQGATPPTAVIDYILAEGVEVCIYSLTPHLPPI